jgi:signal peptidase I
MFWKSLFQNRKTEFENDIININDHDKICLFEDILNKGLFLRVKVTGKSMAPFLNGGEIVSIKKVRPEILHTGDLIFFKNRSGQPILHRIMGRQKKFNIILFQTKGDAFTAFDEPIPSSNILGRVINIEKPDSAGKSRTLDMESIFWRIFNHIYATFQIIKSAVYYKVYLTLKRNRQ